MIIFPCIFAIVVLVQLCVCQNLECPKICFCYRWQDFGRVDCVRQGILDVNIGFDGGSGSEGDIMRDVIQVLDLSRNSISILNDGAFNFDELKPLKAIHLSHNSIMHVSPLAFLGLNNLQLLDLSHNRLRRIQSFKLQPVLLPEEIFVSAPDLRVLRLGFNPLEKEDHHRRNNIKGSPLLIAPNLEFLDLGSCHLGHVNLEDFSDLGSLRMLNLSDNQLITLNTLVLENLKNLSNLMLSSNPWPCDGSEEIRALDKWMVKHGFSRICPIVKFERNKVENGKALGPQKAEDDDSLLYYYQALGKFIKEDEWMKWNGSSDTHDLNDVEVFQELDKKTHDSFIKTNSYMYSTSNITDKIYHLNCSVYGIPIVWFLLFAFQAGIFVSFLATFCWMSKSYRKIANRMLNSGRKMSSTLTRRRERPNDGERYSFNSNSTSDHPHGRESHHLLGSSETELDGWGLTTPIVPRAAKQNRRNSSVEGPPTYDEHIAHHSIIIV